MTTQEALFKLLRIALGKEEPSAFPDDVNWQEVHLLSAKQNVASLACEGFLKYSDIAIDEDLKYMWMGYGMMTENTFNRQWTVASHLAAVWCQHGFSVYALKGLAIAQYFPNPMTRSCVDVDVYVCGNDNHELSDDAWHKSNDIVRKLGVDVSTGDYRHSIFTYDGVKVENHRICASSVKGKKKGMQLDAFLKSIIVEQYGGERPYINGSKLLSPSPMFNLIFFIQHAYSHFLSGNITLRHICDWSVLIETYRTYDCLLWNRYKEICEQYGLKKFSDSLTRLAVHVCGINAHILISNTRLIECDDRLLKDCLYSKSGKVTFDNSFKTHLQIARNQIRGSWKYKYFSERPLLVELATSVWGVMTNRNDD